MHRMVIGPRNLYRIAQAFGNHHVFVSRLLSSSTVKIASGTASRRAFGIGSPLASEKP